MNPHSDTAFDACLIRITRGLLNRWPLQATLDLLACQRPRPNRLTDTGEALLRQTLDRGIVEALVHVGWRSQRGLQHQQLTSGRLWERVAVEQMPLEFTSLTLEFLFWLTSDHRQEVVISRKSSCLDWTTGDALFQLLAYQRLRGTAVQMALQRWPSMSHNGIVLLSFPTELPHTALEQRAVDWSAWIAGPHTWCLEALQWQLADQWVAAELQKLETADPLDVIRMAGDQQDVLQQLFGHLDEFCRWDLAKFVLIAAQRLLDNPHYSNQLLLKARKFPLPEERARWGLAATQVVRQLRQLQDWERRARQIRYHDDGYTAAQLWLEAWETAQGQRMCDCLNALVQDVWGDLDETCNAEG